MLGPNGGGDLTSGYFIRVDGCGALPYPGKCYHGNYYSYCDGINKDKPGQGTEAEYLSALQRAGEATTDFITQIVNELQGNDRALSALLGHSSVAFAVDTTDSMVGEIAGIQEQIAEVIQRIQSNPDDVPTESVLVPFNDPSRAGLRDR